MIQSESLWAWKYREGGRADRKGTRRLRSVLDGHLERRYVLHACMHAMDRTAATNKQVTFPTTDGCQPASKQDCTWGCDTSQLVQWQLQDARAKLENKHALLSRPRRWFGRTRLNTCETQQTGQTHAPNKQDPHSCVENKDYENKLDQRKHENKKCNALWLIAIWKIKGSARQAHVQWRRNTNDRKQKREGSVALTTLKAAAKSEVRVTKFRQMRENHCQNTRAATRVRASTLA